MRIGIFDPYLDTLGGGERYMLSIASFLKNENDISVFWDKDLQIDAENKFGIDLSGVKFEKNIFSLSVGPAKRVLDTRNYDKIFFLSDGSFPFFLSKRNYLIFQYPVKEYRNSLPNILKLRRVKKVFCYSNFVKNYLEKSFPGKVETLYPGVNLLEPNIKKEKTVLSVGRFTQDKNSKKQEVLIDAFIQLVDGGLRDWKLILAGSVMPEDSDFVEKLKQLAGRYPIVIKINPKYEELKKLYENSKIYWHATGFGENVEKEPEKAEQFGISVVEAMSAGSVPVVIDAGGLKEIVENGKSGFLWNSLNDLKNNTTKLIDSDSLSEKISKGAIERSKFFGEDRFKKRLMELIQ